MRALRLKKIEFGTLIVAFFTVVVTIISCEKPHKPDQTNECPSDPEALAIVQNQIVPNNNVFELFHNYDEKEKDVNDFIRKRHQREEFNVTRTVYFDFKVLKEYLRLVEEVSQKNNVNPEGIKVVFGAESGNGKNPYQTNVLFVPTTKDQGKQSAYTTQGGKIVFFKNIKPKDSIQQMNLQKGGFLSLTTVQENGLALNGGAPIPPPNNNDPDFE